MRGAKSILWQCGSNLNDPSGFVRYHAFQQANRTFFVPERDGRRITWKCYLAPDACFESSRAVISGFFFHCKQTQSSHARVPKITFASIDRRRHSFCSLLQVSKILDLAVACAMCLLTSKSQRRGGQMAYSLWITSLSGPENKQDWIFHMLSKVHSLPPQQAANHMVKSS